MHCRSLMSSSRLPQTQISPSKSRSKLEALDTLVISTIHNVSNKLCSNSAGVLRQAAAIFPEPEEEQVMFSLQTNSWIRSYRLPQQNSLPFKGA